MSRPNLHPRSICVLLVAACGLAACGAEPSFQTPTQIRQRPERFVGQRVTVRGFALVIVNTTAALCGPKNPCCNRSWIDLALAPSDEPDPMPRALFAYGLQVFPTARYSSLCAGDNCSQTCAPFVPTRAAAYELTGTLNALPAAPCVDPDAPSSLPTCLAAYQAVWLSDVDRSAIFLLTGEGDLAARQPQPVPPGDGLPATFRIDTD